MRMGSIESRLPSGEEKGRKEAEEFCEKGGGDRSRDRGGVFNGVLSTPESCKCLRARSTASSREVAWAQSLEASDLLSLEEKLASN